MFSPPSEEKIQALKEQHGEVVSVETKAGVCVFKACTKADHDRYQSLLFEQKTRSKASEVLVTSCVVYPTKDEFRTAAEKYPFIITTCYTAVSELGGFEADPEVKKFVSGSAAI